MAKRSARTSKAAKTMTADRKRQLAAYGNAKRAAQRRLPVGRRVTYPADGLVKWARGKGGVVKKHEKAGGVFVAIGAKELLCSPFALLNNRKEGDAR